MKHIAEVYEVEKLDFWGCLLGLKKDYFIVMATNISNRKFFPELKFFWSDDLLNFTPLPDLDSQDSLLLAGNNAYLSGEHDKIIHRFNTQPLPAGPSDPKSLKSAAQQKQFLKEIHLVSHLVRKITAGAAIVPYEAFSLDFNDSPRVNPRFKLASADLTAFSFLEKPGEGLVSKFKGFLISSPRDKK